MYGVNYNYFLMDSEPSGRIKLTQLNWTGVAYKIPRTYLERCADEQELKQAGVYFLFGKNEDGVDVVYVGQAGVRKNGEGLMLRVKERHTSIDYWTEAIMLTTKDNSFGPTEINYLENRFCNMAVQAKRYSVKNGNEPNQGHLTAEKKSELEMFISYAKVVVGILGYNIFEPVASAKAKREQTLYMDYNGVKAKGQCVEEGFIVFEGSTIHPGLTNSCKANTRRDRERYSELIDRNNTLTQDILFPSISAAAAFVGGASLNGRTVWKNEDLVPYGDIAKENEN